MITVDNTPPRTFAPPNERLLPTRFGRNILCLKRFQTIFWLPFQLSNKWPLVRYNPNRVDLCRPCGWSQLRRGHYAGSRHDEIVCKRWVLNARYNVTSLCTVRFTFSLSPGRFDDNYSAVENLVETARSIPLQSAGFLLFDVDQKAYR